MNVNIGCKLFLDGYIYVRSKKEKGKVYWNCNRLYKKECSARAITCTAEPGEEFHLYQGPDTSEHSHPPDYEECQAALYKVRLKRKAIEHPDEPPSKLIRDSLPSLPAAVIARLPERFNLKKAIRHERKKTLPKCPTSIEDLGELPIEYTQTIKGDKFLIREGATPSGKILVYSTSRNLELLSTSNTWFMDGTFKVAPTIFTQVFTILGLLETRNTSQKPVAVPLVYALLSSKHECQYTAVLEAIKDAALKYNISNFSPRSVMSDFERAIINSCKAVFPSANISCCFFHLGQNIYRKIQDCDLQSAYNNYSDNMIRLHTKMILATAFIPETDIPAALTLLRKEIPGALQPILQYFDETYVTGTRTKSRKIRPRPLYPVLQWNQFTHTMSNMHRTNNVSEGWHNRFRILVGKNHPNLYTLINELKKEQNDVEVQVAELQGGRKVKCAPRKHWLETQNRLHNIVQSYSTFKSECKVMDYLRNIAHQIYM